MRHLAKLLLFCACMLVLAGCSGRTINVAAVPEGERSAAPAFELPSLEGKGEHRLADYQGKPLLINFWASYCVPCRREMPALAEFAKENPGIAVLGIATADDPEDSREFAREMNVNFPLARDKRARVLAEYGGTGMPYTVLVDAEGKIVSTPIGELDAQDLKDLADMVETDTASASSTTGGSLQAPR